MKKLLIIALLFWGCDYAPTDHTHSGVCVGESTAQHISYYNYCYNNINQAFCIEKTNDIYVYSWIIDYTCEEFCQSVEKPQSCFINPDPSL